MNLKTITYDTDTWQLMPRAVNPNMSKAAEIVYCSWLNKQSFKDDKIIIRYLFDALLAAAPQPETISPWRGIETAPKDGSLVLVGFWRDGEAFYDFDFLNDGIWQLYFDRAEHYQIGGGNISPEKAPYTHWMPLPQAPTALLGATGATAPEMK